MDEFGCVLQKEPYGSALNREPEPAETWAREATQSCYRHLGESW